MASSKSSIRKYTQDDIKAKIQDKETHLKQCQGNYSEQGSKINLICTWVYINYNTE